MPDQRGEAYDGAVEWLSPAGSVVLCRLLETPKPAGHNRSDVTRRQPGLADGNGLVFSEHAEADQPLQRDSDLHVVRIV